MFKKTVSTGVSAIVLAFGIAACATSAPEPTTKTPGFLPDYSVLQKLPSKDDGTQGYVYKNPNSKRSDYHGVIVDPVVIYQPAGESGVKVTSAQIEQTRQKIESNLKELVSHKLPIVTKPGPGVARLNVAITGAVLEGDGFSPRYLIPVSAVIKMASMATGLDNKKPVLVVETKVTDSQTGEVLRASVATISGDKFRMEASTPEEFAKLANTWIERAMQYSAEQH